MAKTSEAVFSDEEINQMGGEARFFFFLPMGKHLGKHTHWWVAMGMWRVVPKDEGGRDVTKDKLAMREDVCVRLVCDLCARLVCDLCATCVRLVCDLCVRLVCAACVRASPSPIRNGSTVCDRGKHLEVYVGSPTLPYATLLFNPVITRSMSMRNA